MSTAKDLYPEEENEKFFSLYSYEPIIKSFGDIAVQVDDDDYQGDSRILYDLPYGEVGYLQFGWGVLLWMRLLTIL